MVSQLLFGELVQVESFEQPWANVTTILDNYSGFCDTKHLHFLSEKEAKRWQELYEFLFEETIEINSPWGKQKILKGSFVDKTKEFSIGKDHFSFDRIPTKIGPSSSIQLAMEYLNAPYLWGGKSPFGIDCSGLTQQVFRAQNYNLPRDASQQVDCGLSIEFEDRLPGDLAFFHNKDGKIIHVGLILHNQEIIHASGMVRVDNLTENGIINIESGEMSHTLNCIKRL